ncbi:MAG TPA: hypothetical protein VFP84_07685 [Kofleriaceae bacterium]|nr:hypothetical protein [Kofleriaceae bacterium]
MKRAFAAAVAANLCVVAACAAPDDAAPTADPDPAAAPAASAARVIHGSRMHAVAVAARAAPTSDPAPLIAAARADSGGVLAKLAPRDFAEVHRHVAAMRHAAKLMFVTMRQTVAGVPIDDTYLHLALRDDGHQAKLVASSYHLFDHQAIDTTPAITADRARTLAAQGLRLPTPGAPQRQELVIHQLEGRLQLAWAVTFADSASRAFVIASGAGAGRVITVDTRRFASEGQLVGQIVRGGAPGGLGVPQTVAIRAAQVTGGTTTAITDGDGDFSINVAAGKTLKGALTGHATTVQDQRQQNLLAKGTAGAGPLAFDGTGEDHLAQVTAYYVIDQVHDFVVANGLSPDALPVPLRTLTNIDDTCNAFYNPVSISLNFFRAGGGCNNSAIDTVIAHEYGHFIDDFNGGIQDGGLSEGWGDTLACLWSKQSVQGFDLFPGKATRNCQNDYQYPADGIDEVHNLGQAWAGFAWDVRTNLIARFGEAAGDQMARELILPSLQSNAPDIPTAVREVFLRDDDDGDLATHTPHWDDLIAAAHRHGLGFVVETDTIPPSPITDLAITRTDPTQVTVTWTATGDDHHVGTATSYELRWSTAPLDAASFTTGTAVALAAPRPVGATETATFTVAPGATIYAAVRAIDDKGQASPLSNVVTTTTPAGIPVFVDGAETGAGWTMTGQWHVTQRKASEGTHAFWYGQEATGNYDTPNRANAGDLTSPAIDLTTTIAPVLLLDQDIHVELDPLDTATITVQDLGDPSHTLRVSKDTAFSNGVFAPRTIPLVGFAGKRIRLQLHFDTVDYIGNQTEGWYVDHVRIVGSGR